MTDKAKQKEIEKREIREAIKDRRDFRRSVEYWIKKCPEAVVEYVEITDGIETIIYSSENK